MLPPIKPMLAKLVKEMPIGTEYSYEPKWDGFRCILFKSGDEIFLQSRNEKPLTRYFPELLGPLQDQLPDKCVIDGELVVIIDNRLAFTDLQQRVHPAASRIHRLAKETPASFVAFDILAVGEHDLRAEPFHTRRENLNKIMANAAAPLYLTPHTESADVANKWFVNFEGAGLDGLIVKDKTKPYEENKRSQMKRKHRRSADAVVAGFRWHKDGNGIGSLLLGLYDNENTLRHVGVAASFTKKQRTELIAMLESLTKGALASHPWKEWAAADETDNQVSGVQHRWNGQKSTSWTPLHLKKVVEVSYGSTLGGRFREVTRVLRWRNDRSPDSCRTDQLIEPTPAPADIIFTADTQSKESP